MKYILFSLLSLVLSANGISAPYKNKTSDKLLFNIANKIISSNYNKELDQEKILRREIIKNPKDLLPRIKIARLFITENKFFQAISFLRRGVYYNQSDWRGWYWLGTGYLISNDLKHANKSMDAAIKLSNENIYPIMQKAIILQERGLWKESIAYLMNALKKLPDNPTILLNIGYSAEMDNDTELMVQSYNRFMIATKGILKYAEVRSIVSEVIVGKIN